MFKRLFLMTLLVIVIAYPAYAIEVNFSPGAYYERGKVWDATDGSFTWAVWSTSTDLSKVIEMGKYHTLSIDWLVTNAAAIEVTIYLDESNDGTNWILGTDNSGTITSTTYGYKVFSARKGLFYTRLRVVGTGLNTNSNIAINYFAQE